MAVGKSTSKKRRRSSPSARVTGVVTELGPDEQSLTSLAGSTNRAKSASAGERKVKLRKRRAKVLQEHDHLISARSLADHALPSKVEETNPRKRVRKAKRLAVKVEETNPGKRVRKAKRLKTSIVVADDVVETEETVRADAQRTLKLLDQVLESKPGNEIMSDEDTDVDLEKELDAPMNRKIFVGGLPFRASPDAVEAFFEKCGDIDSFNMPVNKDNGKAMGVAFIVYESRDSVERALLYDGKKYDGLKIRVKVADPSAKGKARGEKAGDSRENAEKGTDEKISKAFDKGNGKGKGKGKGPGKTQGKGKNKGKGKGKRGLKS